MTATTISLNSTNFEDVPIVVNTAKKSIGYNENFQIELDNVLDRIQSTFVESVQFPSSKYLFNIGNNNMSLLSLGSPIIFKNGTYTGDELAEELTNRFSEDPTGTQFQYEWSYNNITNIFTISGGDVSISIRNRSNNPSGEPDLGNTRSNITPLISFFQAGDTQFAPTVTVADSNNPGEFIATSSYESYGNYVIQSATNIFSMSETLGVIPFSISTSAGITGFALATEIQTIINARPELSGFIVTYNTNNFKLLIRNESNFNVFVWPTEFGGPVTPDLVEGSVNQYETGELHGATVTHTITSGVNDIFTINEGNGDIDITLPAVTSATLPELAVLLQTAFDTNLSLVNSYEITFSSRTTRFRIKSLAVNGKYPLWSLVINTASSIFGYTIAVALQVIIKSDTTQFELFPALSSSSDATILPTESIVLPYDTPASPAIAASQLETAIATIGFTNTYTVTYDDNKKIFIIDAIAGGVFYVVRGNRLNIGANGLYGYVIDKSAGGIFTENKSDVISLMYGPTYLYIKSNALSEKKITTISADPFYKNVIGKIILNKEPIQVIFNNFSISIVNKLAEKQKAQTIDFRLEDEDGILYNSNNVDWAFTLVFERF